MPSPEASWGRLFAASVLAGLAVHVASGGRRPSPSPAAAGGRRVALLVVDDLEPADCSDVLEQHGIQVQA